MLTVQIEDTPSPTDPPNADEFYRALGVALIASGRLEGLVNLCLINMMALAGGRLGYVLPIAWKRRADLWREALKAVPALTVAEPYFPDIAEVMDAVESRNSIVHAMWERFISADPLAISALRIKHKKGTLDEIETARIPITVDALNRVAAQANHLNRRLLSMARFLSALRRPPPDTRTLLPPLSAPDSRPHRSHRKAGRHPPNR